MDDKRRNLIGCEKSSNLMSIGEGDHICDMCGVPSVVISDYIPAEDYLKCAGENYEA